MKRRGFLKSGFATATPFSAAVSAASTTSVARRGGRIIDISTFGALGDGLADDSSAIQSAPDAATPGDTVVIPAASAYYRCAKPLKVATSGVTVSGSTPGSWGPREPGGSQLRFDKGVRCAICVGNEKGQLYGIRLRDFKLVLQEKAGTALRLDCVVEVELSGLDIWHSESRENVATAISLSSSNSGEARWTGLVRLWAVRISWFCFGVVAENDRWITSISIVACAISGLSPRRNETVGIANLGNGSYIGAGTDIEGWGIAIRSGAGGGLQVLGARFEANAIADVEVQDSAVDVVVAMNMHSSTPNRLVSIADKAKRRNSVLAYIANHPELSVVSEGRIPRLNQQIVAGPVARYEIVNPSESVEPCYVLEVRGTGIRVPNSFGETNPSPEVVISSNLWPLKLGSGSNVYLYAGNTPRLEVDAKTGSCRFHASSMECEGRAQTQGDRLRLLTNGNYFVIRTGGELRLIESTNWSGGAAVSIRFQKPVTLRHGETNSGPFKGMALAGSTNLRMERGGLISLRYDSSEECWFEQSRAIY